MDKYIKQMRIFSHNSENVVCWHELYAKKHPEQTQFCIHPLPQNTPVNVNKFTK